ncbi:hypothetical protein HY732_04710 [Candidatus Uhrbacteria bacterium]|nr:hypothetical protein [Candidatus Uhrbacteria bacterium]
MKKFSQVFGIIAGALAAACAPLVPTSGSERMVVAGGRAGDVSTATVITTGSPQPTQPLAAPVVTTQDQHAVVFQQEIATSDSGIIIRFSIAAKDGQEFPKEGVRLEVDRAKLGLAESDVPRLYQVRDDQFGQTELVDAGQQTRTMQALSPAGIIIPMAGNFLLALKERFSFVDDVIEAIPELDAKDYGMFPVMGDGTIGPRMSQAGSGQDVVVMIGSYPVTVSTWTQDESFPVKVNVFMHPGSGSESRTGPYSFSEWVKYNTNLSPRKDELAGAVRGYFVDRWNTRLGPDMGASVFNANRQTKFDQGTPWVHVCHSAGCNEATSAWLNDGMHRYNDLGRIELAPARGGSQYETPELIYATIAKLHLSPFMSLVYLLSLRDAGELNFSGKGTAPIAALLVGKPQTLLNENGRTLAWDGRSVGIPNTTYSWFALGDISLPFLQKRISETVKYRATPCGSDIPKDQRYVDLRTGECYYNYAQKLDFLEKWYATESVGVRDVIAAYVPTVDPDTVKKAEETVLSPKALRYAIPWKGDKQFKERFERDALPLGCFLIARSPSIVPSDPLPNENILCDCAVPVAQQLRLKDGRSILKTGSTYRSFGIDEGAVQERLPPTVRKFKIVKMNHADVATGSPETWDIKNQYLLERRQKLRDEENNLVLTDEDKWMLKAYVVPQYPERIGFDPMSNGIFYGRRIYTFYPEQFTYTQNPLLQTGQKNRVRVIGRGYSFIEKEWYNGDTGGYDRCTNCLETERWTINRDFIKRNGRWHLVRLPNE